MNNSQKGLPFKQKQIDLNLTPKIHEAGEKQLIIYDGMNLAHRAYNAYNRLRHKGKSVGVIFGIPQIIKSYILRNRPERIIVAWDGDRSKVRLKKLPGYKSHRVEAKDYEIKREDIHRQVEIVKKLLYYMGIAQVYNKEVEGDDMIYLLKNKYKYIHPIRIVSSDKDMLQLIDHDTYVDNPMQINSGMLNPMLMYIEKGWHCYQMVDYLCLVGDDSDDIPGYPGIGDKRAKDFLQKHDSILKYLKNKKSDYSGLSNKTKLRKIWKRNRILIDLKRYCDKYHKQDDITFIKDKQNPQFNEEKYRRLVLKYGMKSMILPQFINTFKQ